MTRTEQLKQLCEKATPGPWYHGFKDGSGRVGEYGGACIVNNPDDPDTIVMGGRYDIDYGVIKAEDAEFIAASRTALPELIALCGKMAGIMQDAYDYGYDRQKCEQALTAWAEFKNGVSDE